MSSQPYQVESIFLTVCKIAFFPLEKAIWRLFGALLNQTIGKLLRIDFHFCIRLTVCLSFHSLQLQVECRQ